MKDLKLRDEADKELVRFTGQPRVPEVSHPHSGPPGLGPMLWRMPN